MLIETYFENILKCHYNIFKKNISFYQYVFLSFYLFITILCSKMSSVYKPLYCYIDFFLSQSIFSKQKSIFSLVFKHGRIRSNFISVEFEFFGRILLKSIIHLFKFDHLRTFLGQILSVLSIGVLRKKN